MLPRNGPTGEDLDKAKIEADLMGPSHAQGKVLQCAREPSQLAPAQRFARCAPTECVARFHFDDDQVLAFG